MLIRASEYDLAYGSIYIGFVNRKKDAMYSFWGDDIPVIPNPSYFPKTDNDIKMSSWMETTSNHLALEPNGYGYKIGNLSICQTPSINMAYDLDLTNVNNLDNIKPVGYGYYSDNLDTVILSDLTIPNVNLFVQDSNPINI